VKAYNLEHTLRKPGRPRTRETLVVAEEGPLSELSL
jgi:hypothetical protein